MDCRNATDMAARIQRTKLLDACAAAGAAGFISTRKVFVVYCNQLLQLCGVKAATLTLKHV
jgi:hypothetical protein